MFENTYIVQNDFEGGIWEGGECGLQERNCLRERREGEERVQDVDVWRPGLRCAVVEGAEGVDFA